MTDIIDDTPPRPKRKRLTPEQKAAQEAFFAEQREKLWKAMTGQLEKQVLPPHPILTPLMTKPADREIDGNGPTDREIDREFIRHKTR